MRWRITPERPSDWSQRQQYFIQYHLYTVALHKYLSLRLSAYECERHFGGVIYLFLRGLDPARPDHGAFRDRPSAGAVQELAHPARGQMNASPASLCN